MADLELSPQVFLILSRIIEDHSGLHYEAKEAALLASKVSPRALERGFDSLLDYYYFLRYDADGKGELDEITDRLVVHETYFFREVDPLVTLADRFLAPRVAAGQRVRVWSAACATGEEPLTLAMVLAGRGLLGSVEIVASDVSERALQRAKNGHYNGRALRAMPHPEARTFIDSKGRVTAAITSAVRWQRTNLIDPLSVAALGAFDVILCRNVLIYFADDTAKLVLDNLTGAMKEDSFLLVGVSESLMRFGNTVHCEEHAGSFFYRKGQP